MELLDIVMLLGVAYVSWRAGKSVGQTLGHYSNGVDPEVAPVKEKILIEKHNGQYFAFKQNHFVTQNEDLTSLILDAMGGNENATLVADNKAIAAEITALLDAVRRESDKSQSTTPTH